MICLQQRKIQYFPRFILRYECGASLAVEERNISNQAVVSGRVVEAPDHRYWDVEQTWSQGNRENIQRSQLRTTEIYFESLAHTPKTNTLQAHHSLVYSFLHTN